MRNLEVCTGKYIAFCEGDDYWIDKSKCKHRLIFLKKMYHTPYFFKIVYFLFIKNFYRRKDKLIFNWIRK